MDTVLVILTSCERQFLDASTKLSIRSPFSATEACVSVYFGIIELNFWLNAN